MLAQFPDADVVFIESGGDNLAATFSPELTDLTIYVIDVAGGEKIPRKGGPGITKCDLLVINKTDLAPYVGADPRGHASPTPSKMRGDAALRDDQPQDPQRAGRGGGLHRAEGDAGHRLTPSHRRRRSLRSPDHARRREEPVP